MCCKNTRVVDQRTAHGPYRTDIVLTEQGEHAAQELNARLNGLSFLRIFTSPLRRARRTAELAGFGESAQADPDLMEWSYGNYEGMRMVDIRAKPPAGVCLKMVIREGNIGRSGDGCRPCH